MPEKREADHLFKTLRARQGEKIKLIDGRGIIAAAKIGKNKEIIVGSKETEPEPTAKLHLFVAPPRKQKMDSLLKQCAEIGVSNIAPIITERSVSTPEKVSALDRWKALLPASTIAKRSSTSGPMSTPNATKCRNSVTSLTLRWLP